MATPTYISDIPEDTDISVLEVGAQALDFQVHEQNRLLAGVLEAKDCDGLPLYPIAVVLQPRRSAKTTGIWEVLIGRCMERPGTVVITTAQDGTRARDRLKDQMRLLRGRGFVDASDKDVPGGVLGVLYWGNGDERIEFTNGSRILQKTPQASAIRGDAADVLFFDEAGELDLAKSMDLLSGALPLLDTRPMGQAIIAGTPGLDRAGLFWDTLQDGRDGREGTGILDYSIRDDEPSVIPVDPDDPESEMVLNEDVLRRVHPGVGTLTTMAKMRQRFDKMQLAQFEREYLCRFPFSSTSHAIDPQQWETLASERVPRPERVGVAFDCSYDGSSASVVYAWRDEDGVAYFDVVDHRPSTTWVPRTAAEVRRHYPRVALGFDAIGANLDPAAAIQREARTAKMDKVGPKEIAAATQRLVSLVSEGRVRHFNQTDLNEAIENATFRDLSGGRAFRQRVPGGPAINPLVAASIALWTYDRARDRKPIAIVA